MRSFASFVGGVEEEAYGVIAISFDDLSFNSFRIRLFAFRRRRLIAFGEFVITFADEADGREVVARRSKGFRMVGEIVGGREFIACVRLIFVAARGIL